MAKTEKESSRLRRAKNAAAEFLVCVDERFTGNVTFDFKDGRALVCRKLYVKPITEDEDQHTLDGGTRPR
jgi:hypothetical protein